MIALTLCSDRRYRQQEKRRADESRSFVASRFDPAVARPLPSFDEGRRDDSEHPVTSGQKSLAG
jgi:hypothetical protein